MNLDAHFRRVGLRRTPQRYDVLNYLARRPVHATVDEIFEALNRRNPRVSRATIYNSLHELVRSGLVREVPGQGSAARFDANLNRHHHFICDRCGTVEDVDWFEIPSAVYGAAVGKRTVRDHEIVLRGVCAHCRKSAVTH